MSFGSLNPNPPCSFGLQIPSRLTKANFDFSSLLPQSKFLCIPQIIHRTDFGAERIDKRYMGIACIIAFTKIKRLGRFKGRRTQLESFCFIFSRRSCQEAFFSYPTPRGIPRYLEGIVPFENPRILIMFL